MSLRDSNGRPGPAGLAAWREIYDAHVGAVRRVCRGFADFPAADVEELVQETFVHAFENVATLRDPERVRPWLLAVARSRALKRLRRKGLEIKVLDVLGPQLEWGATPKAPDVILDRERRIGAVRKVIENLPAGPERETVQLFYVDGELSAAEIATRMGVGKSTITMRLERFRARVKERLAALLAEEEAS